MTEVLLLLVKVAVGVLILAIGMGATLADLTYLWRRPGLLLRSLLAMYVLVPLVAFLLVKIWPLAPGIQAALLVLAVSAGAPLLPRKLQRFGSNAYVFSLVVYLVAAGHRGRAGLGRAAGLALRRRDGAGGDRRGPGDGEGVPAAAGARHAAQGGGSDAE